MKDWFDVSKKIELLVCQAAEETGLEIGAFEADVNPADPRFGDFQANGVLPYAKQKKQNPRQIAQELIVKIFPQLYNPRF